jgi:DNA repair protein RadC
MEDGMSKVEEDKLIYDALSILKNRFKRGTPLSSPAQVREYLALKLSKYEREVFMVLFLDTRHRVIKTEEMFFGTLDGACVYPREVVKEALGCNAGAVIVCHNHPSGVSEPSMADQAITRRLKNALLLVEIRMLDHFIIAGGTTVSMASRGML